MINRPPTRARAREQALRAVEGASTPLFPQPGPCLRGAQPHRVAAAPRRGPSPPPPDLALRNPAYSCGKRPSAIWTHSKLRRGRGEKALRHRRICDCIRLTTHNDDYDKSPAPASMQREVADAPGGTTSRVRIAASVAASSSAASARSPVSRGAAAPWACAASGAARFHLRVNEPRHEKEGGRLCVNARDRRV